MLKTKSTYNGERHSILKPEHVVIERWYSFSYNPIDQPSSISEYPSWFRQHRKMFESCFNSYFLLHPEFSKMARYHFHGIVRIKDITMFYLLDLPKLIPFGTIEMDHVKDPDVWLMYCTKNQDLMERIVRCTDINLPYRIDTRIPYE